MGVDASEFLGTPQVDGVRVNPFGAMRSVEKRMLANSGGIPVSGNLAVAVGDRMAGKTGRETRVQNEQLANVTPAFGKLGYLAVTADEIVLMTTKLKGQAGLSMVDVVARTPRGDVASAEIGGGWRHISYSIISAAPFRITFTDGTIWQTEVSRFSRKHGKSVVRTLSG